MANDTGKSGQSGQASNDTKPRRMSLGLRVVFFMSLALNLAIAGIVAGFVLRGGPDRDGPKHIRDVVAPYTQALSKEDRRELGRKFFREARAGLSREELHARIRAEYNEALDLLRTEPFDRNGFGAVLERQNMRAEDRNRKGQAFLIDHVAGMSAAERAAYAARVAEALERGKRDRK